MCPHLNFFNYAKQEVVNPRYPVGAPAKIQVVMDAITPTPLMDASLAAVTGVPRRVKR